MSVTAADIWTALQDVKDPEIPVVSVVEMGLIRDVVVSGEQAVVTMTPTFAGCPALDVIRDEIAGRVRELGLRRVEVQTTLHPPWSSDWITSGGRAKLKQFGLAPPPVHRGDVQSVIFFDTTECPRCGQRNVELRNSFGPTLCRAIWYCHTCQDAFEQFKPL